MIAIGICFLPIVQKSIHFPIPFIVLTWEMTLASFEKMKNELEREKSVKKTCPTKWDFYYEFSNTVTVPYGTWDRNKILLSQSWALPFFV